MGLSEGRPEEFGDDSVIETDQKQVAGRAAFSLGAPFFRCYWQALSPFAPWMHVGRAAPRPK